MSTAKNARKPLYAAIGAGSVALEKARELPQRVITLLDTFKSLNKIDIRELPKQIQSLGTSVPERAGKLVEQSKKLTGTATKRASKKYGEYSKRGEKLVTRIRNSAPTKRAKEQTKSARSRVKGAATSVKKAAEASVEAVSAAVDKATSEQAS